MLNLFKIDYQWQFLFRFIPTWTKHPDYQNIMKNAWSKLCRGSHSHILVIKTFWTKRALTWRNKMCFGTANPSSSDLSPRFLQSKTCHQPKIILSLKWLFILNYNELQMPLKTFEIHVSSTPPLCSVVVEITSQGWKTMQEHGFEADGVWVGWSTTTVKTYSPLHIPYNLTFGAWLNLSSRIGTIAFFSSHQLERIFVE